MINYSIYIASSKPGTKKADIAPRGFPFLEDARNLQLEMTRRVRKVNVGVV